MKYLLCLIEQGMVSVLNIGLNIWLIRIGGGDLFGLYAFWFNVALLAGSVQNGLTLCHLMPLPPGPGTMAERKPAEQALLAASIVLIAVATALVAGVLALWNALGNAGSNSVLSAAIVFVPAYLAYQYARSLAFSRGALLTATITTTMVTLVTAAGLAADWLLQPAPSPNQVLLISGIGYGAVGMAAIGYLAAGLRPRLGHLRAYLPYASLSRWSVMGIACFEATNRLPSFAVAGWFGAAALGRMATTQIPTRVPILAVAALQPALRNDLARRLRDGDWAGFARDTVRGCLVAFAANAIWAVPVALSWSVLAHWLFHGRFVDDVDLCILWAASQTLGSVINVTATAFQVCGAFRLIGFADIAGALGTLAGLALLMPGFGIAGTIAAIAVGQACYLVVTLGQWPRLKRAAPVATRLRAAASAA